MRRVHTHYHSKIQPLLTKAYFDLEMCDKARVVAEWMVDPPQFWKRKFILKVDVESSVAKGDATKLLDKKKG
eukprot:11284871-Ditylum_brightwellii.AAC.1